MHDIDETGYEKRARAGLIPYIKCQATGDYKYLMMVSSDPKFGGPRPMISKGKIENGETELEGALREAKEELGLVADNILGSIFPIIKERVVLHSGTYDLALFGCRIRDRYDFGKWCDETEYTVWMTLAEFQQRGRKDHVKYVEQLERMVKP